MGCQLSSHGKKKKKDKGVLITKGILVLDWN